MLGVLRQTVLLKTTMTDQTKSLQCCKTVQAWLVLQPYTSEDIESVQVCEGVQRRQMA
jgi:hypothetical protein